MLWYSSHSILNCNQLCMLLKYHLSDVFRTLSKIRLLQIERRLKEIFLLWSLYEYYCICIYIIVSLLRTILIHNNKDLVHPKAKSFCFNTPGILLTCGSIPNSPKHNITQLKVQKRAVKSYEKIDECDMVA